MQTALERAAEIEPKYNACNTTTNGNTHNRSLRGLRPTIKLNDVETAPIKPARVTKKSNLKRRLQFSQN